MVRSFLNFHMLRLARIEHGTGVPISICIYMLRLYGGDKLKFYILTAHKTYQQRQCYRNEFLFTCTQGVDLLK